MCRAAERTNETIKELSAEQDETVHAVHSKPEKFNEVNKKSSRKQQSKFDLIPSQKTGKQKECGRCGAVHGPQCLALGLLCHSCGRKNRFKKKCYFQN